MKIEISLIILYHILSLKDIVRLSGTINSIKALGDTEYHGLYSITKMKSLRNMINQMDNANDVNTILKASGIHKSFAQKALKNSSFSNDTDIVLKGLKDSKGSLAAIGTVLKTALMNPMTWIAGAGIAAIGRMVYKATEFDRAINATSKSQSVFASASNELSTLNSQLDATTSRISELKALKAQGNLSPSESSELEALNLQNSELELQIQLKKRSAAQLSDAAVKNAVSTLRQKNTTNFVTDDNTKKVYDDFGTAYNVYDKTDIITATEAEIKKLDELKGRKSELISEIDNPHTSSLKKSALEEELKNTEAEISKQTNNVSSQIQDLLVLRDALSDPVTGLMKDGLDAEAQGYYHSITDIIDDFNTLDLSDSDATLYRLDKLFGNSSGMDFVKGRLVEAAKAGKDLEAALKDMGLSLENLGVEDVDTLNSYFNKLAASAGNASTSVKSLADTESIDNVAAAFSSKNAGYNYELAIGYAQKAADLYHQGLTGTDDFKSFADYISYNMDDSIEAYQNGMEKFNRYFTAENDSGLQNFIQDFKEKRSLGENDDWISNLGNTAQLAKDMGLGVGAVEDILGRMEDYGYISSDQWHSSLNDLAEYKKSLSNLEEIYNAMDSGKEKEALGSDIEDWKANLEMYEEDLSLLDENAIIKIKFAYDNAQLEQDIDNSLAYAKTSGKSDNAVNYYANAIVGQEELINNYEESLGLDREGITIPARFDTDSLYEQLQNASSNEEIIEIQAKISNKNESYQKYLEFLSEQHPELTPELNIDDANDIILNKKIVVDKSNIEEIENENGTISYTANINGLSIPAEKTEVDGVVSYTVDAKDVFKFDPPDKNGIASYSSDFSRISPTAPPIYGKAIYTATKFASGLVNALLPFATGTLLSPAHADGGVSLPQNETALVNELGTESIIRNGKWMLIPGGMHREHLKKGDIILNAGQTKSLMKYGKAAGRGRAYADGTLNSVVSNAYANGSGDTPEPETFDWIENRIKHLESLTENWKTKLESVTTFKAQNSYIGQIISAIQNEISNLNESYNAYMAKAASIGLSSDYVEKIQNGQLNIEDITDENLQEKIKEYQDWYDKAEDCRTSMEDLKIDVKDLNEERIDNITDDFDNLSSLFKTIISHHETLNELAEKQGKSLGQSDYDSLIKYNNELKAAKSEELKNMQAEFQRLMKEQENFVGSDLYLRMQENMFSLKDDIASIDIELENIKDTIVESDFSSFKKNETHLKNFADELDRVGDLLNENDFFTDKGQFTSTGLTKIALISEQMSTARQLAAEYENAIDQLGKHLANGNITQEEYNESLEEYRKNAQNAAADVKQYKEAILDLVKEGLNQELDANKELISARKEALKGLKDYDNYQKKIEDKNKDIQSLQAQLAALEGQSGQNVERQRRELQAKLKELERDKQELIDDRAYDLRMDSYDKARDELQEKYDAYIKDLESNSQAQEKVISDTLKNVQNNYGSIANELNKIGVNMSEDVAKPWLSAKNAANQYMNTMKEAEAKSKITSQKIDTSKREDASVIQSIAPKPSEKGAEKPQAPAPQQPSKPSGPKSPNDLGLDPSPSTKGLSWLNKEVSIRDRLLYNGWASSDRNYQLLHEWAGGQGSWTGTAEQNIHILNALKAAGFSQGGILQATGEDGIFLGRNKEAVLTETQWNTIRNLADTAPVLTHPLPHFSAPQNSDTVTNIFDAPLIQVEGKADEYTVRELRRLAKSIAPMIGKEFYKDARKIGLK